MISYGQEVAARHCEFQRKRREFLKVRHQGWAAKRRQVGQLVAITEKKLHEHLARLGELEKAMADQHERIRATRVTLTTVRGFARITDAPLPVEELRKLVEDTP